MVRIHITKMPAGTQARTDGTDIWVDEDLNAIQLMCAIQHELVHIERGHGTEQLEASEMSVRFETAKRLLSVERIAGHCRQDQNQDLHMRARKLGVTKRVLMDRAATLSEKEAKRAGCDSCRKCPVMAARYAA